MQFSLSVQFLEWYLQGQKKDLEVLLILMRLCKFAER